MLALEGILDCHSSGQSPKKGKCAVGAYNMLFGNLQMNIKLIITNLSFVAYK
jgi:hypothetical protein